MKLYQHSSYLSLMPQTAFEISIVSTARMKIKLHQQIQIQTQIQIQIKIQIQIHIQIQIQTQIPIQIEIQIKIQIKIQKQIQSFEISIVCQQPGCPADTRMEFLMSVKEEEDGSGH